MSYWREALSTGLSTSESKRYAELMIEEMVKSGELTSSITLPLTPDDTGSETVLPPNPAHAPLKLKPRAARVKDIIVDAELVDESRPLGPIAPPAARTPRLPFVKPAPPVMPYADWWHGHARDPRDWRDAMYD